MESLRVKNTPWIEFGPGAIEKLGDVTSMWGGRRLYAVVDRVVLPRVEPIVRRLLGDRLAAVRAYDFPGEPTIAYLDRLAAEARALDADAVVGIGGGSAMDTAKGIAVLLRNPGSGADYQGFGLVKETAAPLVLVPTTAGSGSEATWSAVFINEEKRIKRGINGHHVFAKAAILDPELTLDLPPMQTAISGMDALIHAVESYACKNATPVSRMYSEQAMRLIFPALPRAAREPKDIAARGDMLLGSYLAGVAIINSEVGLSHALSYPLSVRYRVPHGLGNAMLIGATSAYNAEACPDIYEDVCRFAQATGVTPGTLGGYLAGYVHDLGLRSRLSDFGVTQGDIHGLALEAITLKGPIENHRRGIDVEAIERIYEAVL